VDQGTLPEILQRSGQGNLTDAFLYHVERGRSAESASGTGQTGGGG